ncbi:MAG: PilZ domain-containing protein [Desulfuromonadaceae bacterium]|nr:PilZ domain-containing protein [Desulfuromonadaceae bacterium]
MPEKRHYQRVPFVEHVLLQQEELTCQATVLDISLKGILVELSDADLTKLQPGNPWQITLQLASSDIRLHFCALVTHRERNTIGLTFTTMDDDSMSHLRRLLELNTGDADEIERELEYMIRHVKQA